MNWWQGAPGQPSEGPPRDSIMVQCGVTAVAIYFWPDDPDSNQKRTEPLHVCEAHLEQMKAWAEHFGFKLLYTRQQLNTGCKQLVRRKLIS